MRINRPDKIEVEGVEFEVQFSWGEFEVMLDEVAKLPDHEKEPKTHAEYSRRRLLKHITAISNLEDENGKPITKVNEGTVKAMPRSFVVKVFEELINAGDKTEAVDAAGNA